jgi:hypothetical protein
LAQLVVAALVVQEVHLLQTEMDNLAEMELLHHILVHQ